MSVQFSLVYIVIHFKLCAFQSAYLTIYTLVALSISSYCCVYYWSNMSKVTVVSVALHL
jgi:hypothetical protein